MRNQAKVWAGLAALVAGIIGGVIQLEGGFVNDPNDPGGATNLGITEEVARVHKYDGPMGDLPEGLAFHIYAEDYVYKPQFDLILSESPAVGEKLVDAGVNTGPSRPARWLQESLNDLSRGGRDYAKIVEDGRVGPATVRAYKALEAKRGREKACELTLKLMDARQTMHYVGLGRRSHELASFLVGWVDNRIGNVPLDRCADKVLQ